MWHIGGLISIRMKVIARKICTITTEFYPFLLCAWIHVAWHIHNKVKRTFSAFTTASFANSLIQRNARLFGNRGSYFLILICQINGAIKAI